MRRPFHAFGGVLCTCVWLAACGELRALAPHEVLVIANRQSSNSMAIARHFMTVHDVPVQNLVAIDVPVTESCSMAHESFTRQIWRPALRAAAERRLAHVLAWVYSTDLPTAIATPHPMSITGLTFLRNRTTPRAMRSGTFGSILYAGPDGPRERPHLPQSFDSLAAWLGNEMPLPAMMLGYTGPRGSTVQSVRDCLTRGAAAAGTMPTGTIYYVMQPGIRTAARAWQLPKALEALAEAGLHAVEQPDYPAGATGVLGICSGSADPDPAVIGAFLPGAMAEHLTSHAGNFTIPGQTKLTRWIDAGATASCGTVTEPYAIWTKFPHFRFFEHYAAGCTIIESFYGSVRCPLELLLIGDPLAQPWAAPATLTIEGLPAGGVAAGTISLRARVSSPAGRHYGDFTCLLDGRVVARNHFWTVDTTRLTNGRHDFRFAARSAGLVGQHVHASVTLRVDNP